MSSLKNEDLVSVQEVVAVLRAFGELNKRINREKRALDRRPLTLTTRMVQEYREQQEQVRLFGLVVGELWRWKDGAARWLKHHQEDPKLFLRWVDKLWIARDGYGAWRSLIRPKRLYSMAELFRAANIVATRASPKGSDSAEPANEGANKNGEPAQDNSDNKAADTQVTIYYHGGRSYSMDGQSPTNVSAEQHNFLKAFLDGDIAHDTRELEKEGINNVSKVAAKINKKFPGSVKPPENKGAGYYVRVRSLTATR